jgi:hypothetical protein
MYEFNNFKNIIMNLLTIVRICWLQLWKLVMHVYSKFCRRNVGSLPVNLVPAVRKQRLIVNSWNTIHRSQ